MAFCECGTGRSNLGVLGCFNEFDSVKKHISVNTFDSQGNRNSIELSDLVEGKLTDAYILGKFTEAYASKRWFITPKKYENVEPSRTDSTYEDFSSGTRVKIDTGVKAFLGIIPKTAGALATKMESGACTAYGNFEVDTNGSLKGEMSLDGAFLYPIQVSSGSFEAVEIDPVEGTSTQRIQISFQYSKSVNEGQLRIIESGNIEVDLLEVNGGLDGELEATGTPTATSFSATFGIDSPGAFGVVIPIEGQVEVADWEVIDSALGVVTPTGVVEIIAGQYDFTIPSTPSDVLSVTYVGTTLSALDQKYYSNTLTVTTPV